MISSHQQWVDRVCREASAKEATLYVVAAPLQDQSTPILQKLLTDGYELVTWDAKNTRCSKCRELHNQKWSLKDFLSNLNHNAPLFERSHPNDNNCTLLISGEDVPTLRIDYLGNIENV